jgi:hypothetical protein
VLSVFLDGEPGVDTLRTTRPQDCDPLLSVLCGGSSASLKSPK